MRCSKAQRYIDLKLDGELNDQHQLKLNKHLSACPGCRNWQNQAEKLQLMLSAPQPAEFPAWVHANIMDKVHRLDNKRPGFVSRFKLAPATTAIAIIFSFWIGAQVGIKSFNPETDTTTTESTNLLSSNSITFGENTLIDSYDTIGDNNE